MARETERIRELNDAFRTTVQGGKVLMTAAVSALPLHIKFAAVEAMRCFSAFTEDNDPAREHDFGSFEIDGQMFFWKIDCYDLTMEFGSEDPADPAITIRVLTLMLADDY